jgi:hypothetical protein
VISNSDTDPLRSETLAVTVIVPGDAPGLSVPETAMSPITEPADPEVAPERTAICEARIVEPVNPDKSTTRHVDVAQRRIAGDRRISWTGGAGSITGGSLIRTSANAVCGRTGTPLNAPDIAWRRQV